MISSNLFTKDKKLNKENAPIMGRVKQSTVPEPSITERFNDLVLETEYIYKLLDLMAEDLNKVKTHDETVHDMIGSLGVDIKTLTKEYQDLREELKELISTQNQIINKQNELEIIVKAMEDDNR